MIMIRLKNVEILPIHVLILILKRGKTYLKVGGLSLMSVTVTMTLVVAVRAGKRFLRRELAG